LGRRIGLVVVAEGAKDHEGTPITSTEIKDVMEKRLGHEPRITILGHVQRGGVPSSYDRLISTLMGVEAVNAVVETSVEGAESVVIGVRGNKIVRNPLVESVRMTQDVAKAVAEKKWDLAMKLRGGDFVRQWHTFVALTKQKTVIPPAGKALNIAVLNVGAPAPGMNSCNKAIVRLALQKGHTPLAVFNGYKGLADDEVQKFSWIDVDGWSNMGGSLLGSNRTQPDSIISEIVASIKKHDIHVRIWLFKAGFGPSRSLTRMHITQALLVVGGWEGYTGAISLSKNRDKYPELNIPIICIPSTISNNCPGTYQSVGCDTALNTIVEAADRVKQSAVSSRGRVFIMEIMGAKCGYLTTVAALGAGAHVVYLPENGVTLRRLVTDIERLKERFKTCRTTSLILNTDGSNPTYDTSLITKLYAEEGKGFYEVRELILGHIQQGNAPSPIDRIQAAEYAASALDFVTGHYDQEAKPALAPIGVMGNIACAYHSYTRTCR
jgi:6-phosphofructokinase 1